jgi:hypothetical protein
LPPVSPCSSAPALQSLPSPSPVACYSVLLHPLPLLPANPISTYPPSGTQNPRFHYHGSTIPPPFRSLSDTPYLRPRFPLSSFAFGLGDRHEALGVLESCQLAVIGKIDGRSLRSRRWEQGLGYLRLHPFSRLKTLNLRPLSTAVSLRSLRYLVIQPPPPTLVSRRDARCGAWSRRACMVDPTGICSGRIVGFCWARWNDVSFTSKSITSSPLITRWSPMDTSWRVGGACAVVRHCTRSQTPLICRSLPRLPFLIPTSARTPTYSRAPKHPAASDPSPFDRIARGRLWQDRSHFSSL